MSSVWSEQWPLAPMNGTADSNSCFNGTQSTVLNGDQFGGVPLVLLLDFIVFVVLLFIFSIIRRNFWDYGRLALLADHEGEEKVKSKCGVDAVHYLSFQRHLLILLMVLTVSSLGIILPVNLSGDLLDNEFGRTTIGNIEIGNNLLWLHTVFAVVYLILTVVVLRRHTSQMKGMPRETTRNTLFVCSVPKAATEEDIKSHFKEAYPTCQVRTVTLVYDVAKLMYLDKERIRAEKNLQYYERILNSTGTRKMIDPRVCSHLCCCTRTEKVDAIEYYSDKEKKLQEDVKKQVEMVPNHPLGMAFVTLQTEAMAKQILKDFNAVDCGSKKCCCGWVPQPSSNSDALKVKEWMVNFAPHPENVYWDNLSVRGCFWFLRYVLINFFLFVLLTFLTTPTIIITTIDKFNVTRPIHYLNSPIISQFFPTLLLWSFSALLPTIVYYSTIGEAHWSRSSEQLSMMRKLYCFLLFMVLLLPSLGLTSLAVFFRWLFDKEFLIGGKMRFECVFLPNQGAFFVNYVIAAALVGSGMELLRLPGLLLYTIRMAFARSGAERKYVKQNQAYEFEYGAMYAWSLCVFTVIMAYSIICPIIVPFGFLYMTLKHLVDKHNLYFAYLPARIERHVHLGAVNQALAAPIICLIWLYFFSVLRIGDSKAVKPPGHLAGNLGVCKRRLDRFYIPSYSWCDLSGFWAPTSLFTLVVLCVTIFVAVSYTCFGHFKYLSPLNYEVKEEDDRDSTEEEHTMVYLPRVLIPRSPDSTAHDSKIHQTYGTTEESPICSASEENQADC
ncbi:unnamed protein product [Tetraodon nigroviridis]|uniref:(spotted green pufferfish) hypothetical protein n=1 Tax=Tetraodon nigroviridis TaxID=99883 RepID=Q4RRB8_TETNG|nr:unnamed protein product [Tetraodon nigroviridis]